MEDLTYNVFHGRREEEFGMLIEKGLDGCSTFGQVAEELPVVADGTKKRSCLLHIRRHWHIG